LSFCSSVGKYLKVLTSTKLVNVAAKYRIRESLSILCLSAILTRLEIVDNTLSVISSSSFGFKLLMFSIFILLFCIIHLLAYSNKIHKKFRRNPDSRSQDTHSTVPRESF